MFLSKIVLVRCKLEIFYYLLIVGRIRVTRTFAAGQRGEIGGYEDPWEVSLSGLGIGLINEDFLIVGI